MKKLIFLILLLIPFVLAQTPEQTKITSFVNDYSNLLTAEQSTILSNQLELIYNSKKAEMAVVIVDTLDGYDSQDFAQKISNNNLGDSTNNGLLLLVAVDDRKYWFNVGRGLEPIFNDAKIGRIGRNYLVPYFQKEMYYEGVLNSVNAISEELGVNATNKVEYTVSEININPWVIFLIIMFFMSLIRSITADKKKPKNKKDNDDDNLLLTAMLASSFFRGGGRGGFGGSGGFGGFGGGSFGGGGAGGGW
ncbi:TPM domain-containing protein [Candidatus Woesearchaeota archaeon]|nr:TPM domain-containing protein [Candidatus Woesearchaeota archaeon]